MILHYLLSTDESGMAIAMSTVLTKEEKCTQYKLGVIAKYYRMNLIELLNILNKAFTDNSKELSEFLTIKIEELDKEHDKLIRYIRDSEYADVRESIEVDSKWLVKLLIMEW